MLVGLTISIIISMSLNLRLVLLVQQLEKDDYRLRAILEVSGFCFNSSDRSGVKNVSIGYYIGGYSEDLIPHGSVLTDENGYYRLVFKVPKTSLIKSEANVIQYGRVDLVGLLPGHFVTSHPFSFSLPQAEISIEDIMWGDYNSFQFNFSVLHIAWDIDE